MGAGGRVREVVVVGASVAGLLTAAALARDGRRVTLLDRDELPDGPQVRPGVPQGRQPHLLLRRGLQAVDELLPGYAAELHAAGAVPVDTGDIAWLGATGWAPPTRSMTVLLATRPLIEHLLRQRVLALPGVRCEGGRRVTGLRRGAGGGPRWWVDADTDRGPEARPADLVVDASGRSSRLPVWLAALGVAPAPVEELDAHVGYATVHVQVPPGRVVAKGVVVLARPGRGGAVALPAEHGRWTVSGIGAGAHRPPRDASGLRAFLAAARDDAAARVLDVGEPLGDVATHRQTGNRRHRYDRVTGWPDSLLVVGDALCAFDPVYGQGMTVAALEACALRDAAARADLGARGAAARAVRTCVRVGEVPWQLATAADRELAGAPPSRTPVSVLAGWWIGQLDVMSTHGDDDAQRALSRVYHLVATPTSLFRPRLAARWLRTRLHGLGPPTPHPAVLREDVPGPVGGGR